MRSALVAALLVLAALPAGAHPAGPPDDASIPGRAQSLAPVPMLGWPWLVGDTFRMRVPPGAKIVAGATLVRETDGLDAALVDVGDRIRLDVQHGRPQSSVEGLASMDGYWSNTADGRRVQVLTGVFRPPFDARYSRFAELVAGDLRISAFCKDDDAQREAIAMIGTLSIDAPASR